MREIGFDNIKIQTPYKLLSIEDFKLKHDLNDHGRIYIKGIVDDKEGFKPSINTQLKDYIRIIKIEGEEEKTIFKGQIATVEISREGGLYRIEIEGITSTFLLDTKKKHRSFQNINMTYRELIKKVITGYKDSDFILNVEDRKIQKPIIQWNETDWEFIKRLASHFNTVLISDILENKPRFYFGFAKKRKKEIKDTGFYRASKDLQALKRAKKDFHDTDFFYYEIESRDDYEIQDEVWFKQKRLYISKVEAFYDGGMFTYKYRLSRIKGIYINKKFNDNIVGISIEGKVIDTKEEKVKLHLKIDKEQKKNEAYWFPFAPLTNDGMYCMPELNTYARLYFPSNKEKDGQVASSVRKNGNTCKETNNPDIRYFTTKDKNQIKITPASIDIKPNTGSSLRVSFDDEKGVKIKSHKDIAFNALEEITFKTPGKIQLAALDQIVLLGQNPRQSLSIENEFHLLGRNVYIEGRERKTYPPFDDAPEVCKLKKKAGFNWGKLAKNMLCGLAVVGVVALSVATLGTGVAVAACVAGSIAIVGKGVSDVLRGEVSSVEEYVEDAIQESLIGAACGVFAGAVEGLALGGKALKVLQAGEKLPLSQFAKAIGIRMGIHTLGGVGESLVDQSLRGEGIKGSVLLFDGALEGLTVGFIDGQIGRKIAKKLDNVSPAWLRNGAEKVGERLRRTNPKEQMAAAGFGGIKANDLFSKADNKIDDIIEETDVQKNYNRVMAEVNDGASDDFIGTLRGEKVKLPDVKTKEINYIKRNTEEAKKLRNAFNSTERKKFLQSLTDNVEKLKQAGLSDSDIARMKDGLNPKGWQVHHKLPLDDGGTNDMHNLILIKNEPYHKTITNFQNTFAKQLSTGEVKKVKWPIPEGNIYPPNN